MDARPLVFLCYSSTDQGLAGLVARELRETGADVRLLDDVDSRDAWKDDIERAEGAILLITDAFVRSDRIRDEEMPMLLGRARRDHMPILPIALTEPSALPLRHTPELKAMRWIRADVVEADDGSGPVFSGNTLGRIRDWMHRYFPRGARQAQGRNIPYPDIAWVEIPGGPFLYQGETRELPTFWLARYPVTNAQYQCFIDDGGYDEDRWWADLEKPEPTTPSWSAKNRPRTDVDWYEAMAFCRWFNARLGLAADTVRLPTEIEWERAAAGREGADYPWGKGFRSGFANLDENENKDGPWHLEQATAVGVYPHGASAEGALDLAGQVWEWCLNKHEDIDATRADGSSDSRALRGGSWFYYPDFARASFRYWDYPDYRNYHWGFRLLSSSPPVL